MKEFKIPPTENLEEILLTQQKANIRWFIDELFFHYPSTREKIIEAIPKDVNEAWV